MEEDTERPVIKSAWKQVERGHGGYIAGDDYFYPCILKQGLEGSKHFNIGLLLVRSHFSFRSSKLSCPTSILTVNQIRPQQAQTFPP